MNTAVATLEPTRLPIPMDVAKKYDLSQTQWRVLTDQIFPSAKTVEAVVMAIEYCRSRKLDIMKRPVHIVPVWSSAKGKLVETVWPGIAEIRTTAARTGQYVGMDEIQYGPMITRSFTGTVDRWENKQKTQQSVTKEVTFPEWGSVVLYRLIGGHPRAFHTKIYWMETYGTLKGTDIPNDMWAKRPIGQFDKCLEAAALRKAFPEEVGNDLVAEEMEGRTIDFAGEVAATPKPPRPDAPSRPASAPPKPNGAQAAKPEQKSELAGKQVEDATVEDEIPDFDRETGEIVEGETEVDRESEAEELTPSDMLTLLDDAMQTKATESDVLELWNEHDLPARLAHVEKGEEFVAISMGIRNKHLKRVRSK